MAIPADLGLRSETRRPVSGDHPQLSTAVPESLPQIAGSGLSSMGIEQSELIVIGYLELSEPCLEVSASHRWIFHLAGGDATPELIDAHVEIPEFNGRPEHPSSHP